MKRFGLLACVLACGLICGCHCDKSEKKASASMGAVSETKTCSDKACAGKCDSKASMGAVSDKGTCSKGSECCKAKAAAGSTSN